MSVKALSEHSLPVGNPKMLWHTHDYTSRFFHVVDHVLGKCKAYICIDLTI